ncbi:MAG: response regulator [Elusimicrobia bacterium]|nr:response regulator [Elusimicrobiota bacterium]MDE2511634.1 response regulator [Elusimicrobiota bacterium]
MTASPMFIVEDDDHFRETFIDVMSLKGVEVSGARNGDEAIKALKQAHPTVIIMDVNLPDVHGFDLCKRVKRLEGHQDTPVIFVSASTKYSDPRDRAEGIQAGGAQFLPKPISVERLWSAIESVLSRARPS